MFSLVKHSLCFPFILFIFLSVMDYGREGDNKKRRTFVLAGPMLNNFSSVQIIGMIYYFVRFKL